MNLKHIKDSDWLYRIVFMIAVILLALLFVPRFSTPANLMNVFRQVFLMCLVAYGMTFALLVAGIDLSIGSIAALSCVVGAPFIASGNVFLGVLVVLLVALGLGMINGAIIAWFNVPDFIMTFSMMYIAKGLALTITQGTSIYNFPKYYKWIGKGFIGIVPIPAILSIIIVIILSFLMKRTTVGRSIYAVGCSKDASLYSGFEVKKIMTSVYALSGLLAGIAGLVYIARLNSADAELGKNWPLEAIAVCVIGGVSFSGGKGNFPGLLIGGVIMAIIMNSVNLIGMPSRFQDFFVGFVIIFVVSIESLSQKVKARRSAARLRLEGMNLNSSC